MSSAGSGRNAVSVVHDRRALILESAARLFAQQGFTRTTIRDIARGAELSSGSLYHHFVSKDEMLVEILRGFLDGLVARFEEIEARGTPPEVTLRALVRDAFRTIHDSPERVALFQSEAPGLRDRAGFEFVAVSTGRLEQTLRRAIRAGQVQGVFRAEVDAGLAYRFIRDAAWSAVHWYRPDGPSGHEELADRYLHVMLRGIVRPAR